VGCARVVDQHVDAADQCERLFLGLLDLRLLGEFERDHLSVTGA
jgi:hypothetical protein